MTHHLELSLHYQFSCSIRDDLLFLLSRNRHHSGSKHCHTHNSRKKVTSTLLIDNKYFLLKEKIELPIYTCTIPTNDSHLQYFIFLTDIDIPVWNFTRSLIDIGPYVGLRVLLLFVNSVCV